MAASHETILVALDGSPRQPAVLDEALALAQCFDAKLHVVRAMTVPTSVPAMMWTLQGDDLGAFLVDHGQKELAEVMAGIAEQHRGEAHTRLGRPADVICQVARDTGADLVVLGSHGYDVFERMLGTTAAAVVHNSPCSVIVVRAHAEPAAP